MDYANSLPRRICYPGLFALVLSFMASVSQPAAATAALGTSPPLAAAPHLRFVFEFRVTLAPAVVVGETAFGRRQYISITGGAIAGPKFQGEVLPGGWDYQLGLTDGCTMLSADYFIRSHDGIVIHVLNEGITCPPGGANPKRSFFRPRFEAPNGAYEWLTRATFVATLELEPPAQPSVAGAPPPLTAIRLKIYQVE